MDGTRRSDPVVRRLTTLIVIQGVLLALMLVAGFFALRALAEVRQAVGRFPGEELGQMAKALERTDDLARQLTARQESLAAALDHRADQTLAEIKRLRQRRQELAEVKGGPIDTAAQAIQMTQLMADQMLVMLDHVAWSQRGMAQALKPLEVQREAQGTGGSGASDGTPKDGEPKDGEPKGGEPKGGEPKGGEPKGGEPKGGEPKGGAGQGQKSGAR